MYSLIIVTCLYDVPHQRLTTPQHVALNGHAPMSESESKQKNTLIFVRSPKVLVLV